MKQPAYTLSLFAIIVADSLVTALIGAEASPVALWIMRITGASLHQFLFWRVVVAVPCLFVIDRWWHPQYVFYAYVGLYTVGSLLSVAFFLVK